MKKIHWTMINLTRTDHQIVFIYIKFASVGQRDIWRRTREYTSNSKTVAHECFSYYWALGHLCSWGADYCLQIFQSWIKIDARLVWRQVLILLCCPTTVSILRLQTKGDILPSWERGLQQHSYQNLLLLSSYNLVGKRWHFLMLD